MQETREAIRARLLHDANVQRAIQMRAYEIWQLRGRYDGRSKEDWMLAENEVLSFLTEQEMKKANADAATQELVVTEVEIVEEVIVVEPAIIAVVEETPVAVAAEIEAAPVAETVTEETSTPAEIPEMGIVLKPVKRTTGEATTPKAPKASKSTEKKQAAPKKTALRKKAAIAEFAPPAITAKPTDPEDVVEDTPKKAKAKRTITPKTTTKKTTRKSAKTEQPSAE